MTVCVSMQKQKQMWIAVTSHAGNMTEIRQSAYLQDLNNVLLDLQLFQYVYRFRLWSLIVTPQIFLNTDISKTLNFLFCSSLNVKVSEL